jgi:hypothetical protein
MLVFVAPSPASCATCCCRSGAMGFSTLVFASRLRLGDAFALAFEHHLPYKLSDPAQHRQHQLAGGRLGVHAEIENPHGDPLMPYA